VTEQSEEVTEKLSIRSLKPYTEAMTSTKLACHPFWS